MLSGCYQLMWAHSHLMWFLMPGYSQLMWSRKTDVIGFCDLCYRAATAIDRIIHHATIIEIEGDSYRKKQSLKKYPIFLTKTGQGNCRHPDKIVDAGQVFKF